MNDNKLISEFMGVKYPMLKGSELQYHTSWDWLMPVVAKCHEINKLSIRLEIGDRNMYGANIEVVYDAVVEFIKTR